MNNIMVGLVEFLISSVCILLIWKHFKETGLMCWVVFAAVFAQIQTNMFIDIFGLTANLGNVMFASIYICSDIIHEFVGTERCKKVLWVTGLATLMYAVFARVTLAFVPAECDYIYESLSAFMNSSFRLSLASLTMLIVSNLCNVYLFDWLKKKFPKFLWLRSGVSTVVCNCSENFCFILLAFLGTVPIMSLVGSTIVGTAVEFIVCLMGVPVVCLAKKFI